MSATEADYLPLKYSASGNPRTQNGCEVLWLAKPASIHPSSDNAVVHGGNEAYIACVLSNGTFFSKSESAWKFIPPSERDWSSGDAQTYGRALTDDKTWVECTYGRVPTIRLIDPSGATIIHTDSEIIPQEKSVPSEEQTGTVKRHVRYYQNLYSTAESGTPSA